MVEKLQSSGLQSSELKSSKSLSPFQPFNLIVGKWQLEREIGQGAYGVVYLAVGAGGERAAVKVCRRDAVGDERYARELRGAKLYASVSASEGLVRMREVIETEWGFCSVMDLADDEFDRADAPPESYRPKTLAKVIEGEKALPLKECVKLGIALSEGLSELQRHHLLHRDIKPGNVIYIGGKPVLSDPGLVVEESEAASIVGTPGYVPPEKFTDGASDIYSLGLTLKAASFGRKLEDLDNGPALEADTGAALFPAWWRILNKATDPTPSRRYQSAKAFVRDLMALRRKIAVMSIVGSRVAKIAFALILASGVVIVASSINVARHAKEEIVKQSKELKPIKDLQDQVRLANYIQKAEAWLKATILEALDVYRASRRLCAVLQNKIDEARSEDEKENLGKVQSELLKLRKQMRSLLVRLYRLAKNFETATKTIDGSTRQTVEAQIASVQKLLEEGMVFEKRIFEIGGMIFGEEEWKPDSIWAGLGGNFGDEQSIRIEGGWSY